MIKDYQQVFEFDSLDNVSYFMFNLCRWFLLLNEGEIKIKIKEVKKLHIFLLI